MFGFKMPQGGQGSQWGQMNNHQRLMSLGSALQGDQDGLAAILSQLGGAQETEEPVKNAEGDDISAAFGGMLPMAGLAGQIPLGLPLRLLTGKKFGFGGR